MNFPLSTIDCRRLAYETAIKNKLKIPHTWATSKLKGIDWFQGFMERCKHLTLRLPEARSIARATSFNKHNVNIFLINIQTLCREIHSLLMVAGCTVLMKLV